MLESQRTPISDECRLRFDDYLLSRFPNKWIQYEVYCPADDIYSELDSVRLGVDKRKSEELYK